MAVSDDQVTLGGARRVDHRLALGQRERHGLFHESVLAGRKGEARVLGMKLMRRRNVERLDRRIATQLRHAGVGASAEIALELRARLRARIARRRQFDPPVGRERRRHQRERATESCNAEADCPHGWRGVIIRKYLGT